MFPINILYMTLTNHISSKIHFKDKKVVLKVCWLQLNNVISAVMMTYYVLKFSNSFCTCCKWCLFYKDFSVFFNSSFDMDIHISINFSILKDLHKAISKLAHLPLHNFALLCCKWGVVCSQSIHWRNDMRLTLNRLVWGHLLGTWEERETIHDIVTVFRSIKTCFISHNGCGLD